MDLLRALSEVVVIDLSHPFEVGMPQSPNHPAYRMTLERRHGDMVREDGGSAANELIVLGGHVGTHVDALAHVSQAGLLHGGQEADALQSHKGFSDLGISTMLPVVGRGVLLDIAALHGVDVLEPGYPVSADDLDAASAAAGVEVNPGDAVLIGTGWSRHWSDRELFMGARGGAPGPDESAGRWLASRRPRVVGGETIAFEQIAAGRGHAVLPVHRIMLVDAGIHIIETMQFDDLRRSGAHEFGFILNPLRLVGATGSPVRPLALVPKGATT